MEKIIRFGVAMPRELLDKFDSLIAKKNYPNRSQALRDLVRQTMVEEEWKLDNKETIGTITIVYNHHYKEISDVLTDLQHHYCKEIISCLHVHLDKENCLEVLVIKGKSQKIKDIADKLIVTKGVKHGKLIRSTTGKEL
jgi:CopG family nickel-responsive transcriptional regulator